MTTTQKQDVWLEVYLRTWNGTEAARVAGYAQPAVAGARNKAALASQISERVAELTMSANETLLRLSEQARAEYSQYITVTEDGAPSLDLKKLLADGKGHLIKGFKETQWGSQVEFHDAQTALLNIGRHHKLFVDRTELSGGLELKEHESAAERILSRIDGIAARLRTPVSTTGDSANRS